MRRTAIILMAAALIAAFFTGCGGKDSGKESEASPLDAAKEFASSVADKDFEGAYAMLTEESRNVIPYEEFEAGMAEADVAMLRSMEFELLEEASDTARVRMVAAGGDEGEMRLLREGGAWRIDLAQSYQQAQGSDEGRTCLANMRMVVTAANVYAADKGVYPSSVEELIDGKYLEGPLSAYDCPSGGTIEWNFNPGKDGGPPEPGCSIHGSS